MVVITLATAFVVTLTACGSTSDSAAATAPSSSGTASTVAATTPDASPATTTTTTSTPPPDDSVPVEQAVSNRGCIDSAGALSAPARSWYPGRERGGGDVILKSDMTTSPELDSFASAAAAMIGPTFAEFVPSGTYQDHLDAGGCATYRSADFAHDGEGIVVSTWRVESAADPYFVPNEAPFMFVDDSTLVSDGDHLDVVLAVARDGTTLRISASGTGEGAQVAGWPTTTGPNSATPTPGPSPASIDQLVPLAKAMLAIVLGQRLEPGAK